MRIASLFPAGTEIVYAIGAGEELVGVSHACDQPPEALERPKATAPRFDASGLSSREIRERQRELIRSFGSLYRLSESGLWGMRPELLVAPGPGELPAVSLENVRAIAQGLNPRPKLVLLFPRHLDDVLDDHVRVGFETGRIEAGRELRERMWDRIEAVEDRAGTGVARKVAFVSWPDPPFAGGYWIPQLVELAGGVDVLANPGFAPSEFQVDELMSRDPDVIVFACEGLSIERTLQALGSFTGREGWGRLRAVRRNRVYVGDGACFGRAGPRLLDGLEALAWAIHPERFPEPSPEVLRRLGD